MSVTWPLHPNGHSYPLGLFYCTHLQWFSSFFFFFFFFYHTGNRNPVVAPFDNFLCKNNTRIVLAIMKQTDFIILCKLLHAEHLLKNNKYRNNNARVIHSSSLSMEIEQCLKTHTADEWLSIFREHGLTCATVNPPSKVFASLQVQARNMALLSKKF